MEREGVREGEREGERERHREAHGSVLVAQHPTQVLDVLVVQGGSWGGGVTARFWWRSVAAIATGSAKPQEPSLSLLRTWSGRSERCWRLGT